MANRKPLTEKEISKIINAHKRGRTNKEISVKYDIPIWTVSSYVRNYKEKQAWELTKSLNSNW